MGIQLVAMGVIALVYLNTVVMQLLITEKNAMMETPIIEMDVPLVAKMNIVETDILIRQDQIISSIMRMMKNVTIIIQ